LAFRYVFRRHPEAVLALPDEKKIHFVRKFKYLGSIITPLLNENAEIEARIKKAKSIMGIARTFFDIRISTKESRLKSTLQAL
jgi:hypothetical protein